MSTWSELREVLLDLKSRDPSPLQAYPDPRDTHRDGPFGVTLAAWADAEAAAIYQRFGATVVLTVGAFSYPGLGRPAGSGAWRLPVRAPAADAALGVALQEPLIVRSGHTLHSEVLVSNMSGHAVLIYTNRQLQSFVVDAEGRVIGGYVGAQRAPGQAFEVPEGSTVPIPVLVGTASLEPRLGYRVPPGDWHLLVDLDVIEGGRSNRASRGDRLQLTSAPLPVTVTS